MSAKETKRLRQVKQFWWVLPLLLYLAVNVVLILHHESWRDEAQAWQIARQSGIAELFEQLGYEGHPCLWYLILMPFAKLGYPFSGLGFLSLFFMGTAAGLLLWKAPFSPAVKVIAVFSSSFLYYYPVVARNYCLIPPILAWLAILYSKRRERPVWYGIALALLTQTHVLAAALSFSLSAVWVLEVLWEWRREKDNGFKAFRQRKGFLIGIGISLFSGLFLVWELAGSIGRNATIQVEAVTSFFSNLQRIGVEIWVAMQEFLGARFDGTWGKILLAAGLLYMAALFFYAWKETVVCGVAFLIQTLIFTYVYRAGIQSSMILVHELIFLLWIVLEKRGKEGLPSLGGQLVLAALLLVSIYNYGPEISKDLREPYSSSRDLAAYIESEVPEEMPLVATGDLFTTALSAYLPEREIWNPVLEETVSFSVWDERREEEISYARMVERVKMKYPDARGAYLICGEGSQVSDWKDYRPWMEEKCSVENCIMDERAALYYIEW